MNDFLQQNLEEENELLRQQLETLTGSPKELGVLMARGYGMTYRLATMLYILVKRAPAVVSSSAFHSVIYGSRADGGPDPKIFNIHIARLRGVLRRAGLMGKIDTIWNAGYRASPELVKEIRDLYSEHIPTEE